MQELGNFFIGKSFGRKKQKKKKKKRPKISLVGFG